MEEYRFNLFQDLFCEEGLAALQKILAAIFDTALNGVMAVEKSGVTIYANPAYAQITGTEISNRLGTNLLVLDPDCPLSKTLRTGQPLKNYRFKLCDAENELLANTSPILDPEGEVLGAISVFQDVQEIARLQEVLREQEQAIRTLRSKLSTVSSAKYNFDNIIGSSPALTQAVKVSKDVAGTDVTVLIQGESGVGKEMFAHAIHANSRRRDYPFIRINCAAIPENLIESELFGFERGAFTGAGQQKIGMFELANKGTILLDEIGEMSMQAQSRLLRVLEEREFYRVGGQRPIKLDIRVLAATNRDLLKAIEEGKFREDLYYRINIFNVEVPPLRARERDVVLLAQYFLEGAARRMERSVLGISEAGKRILMSYNWPGNIRELRNVVERAVIVCHGEMITEKELGFLAPKCMVTGREMALRPLWEMEKEAIQKGLALYGTSMEGKQRVARDLGISFRTLYNRLKEYQLEPDKGKPPQ